jgi:NADH dehydrogenase (ubiquinone) 1 alpha subcomplex subunit 9
VVPVPCQIPNEADVRRALSRSNVVVNCIGSMYETRNYTLHDAHVKTSYRIAKVAKEMGIQRFVQMSTVNNSVNSESKWIATKV